MGGWENFFILYNSENYEIIQNIEDAHNNYIDGFAELNNDNIVSFSIDKTIKVWSIL